MAYHHAALVALAEKQEDKQDVPPLLVVSNNHQHSLRVDVVLCIFC